MIVIFAGLFCDALGGEAAASFFVRGRWQASLVRDLVVRGKSQFYSSLVYLSPLWHLVVDSRSTVVVVVVETF